ncbi:MAG: hypothetical protein JNL57_01220 [Bacteroidetes bacterium]|nr:hypothetical protein [Bacteroidota bacterium]
MNHSLTSPGPLLSKSPISLGITRTISGFPWLATVCVLTGGLLHWKFLVWISLLSVVCMTVVGTGLWLGFTLYMAMKNKTTGREVLLQIALAALGLAAFWLVVEFDLFHSGAKYMD